MMQLRAVWMTNLATALVGFGLFGSFILIPQFVEMPVATGYGFGASATQAGYTSCRWLRECSSSVPSPPSRPSASFSSRWSTLGTVRDLSGHRHRRSGDGPRDRGYRVAAHLL
jgi:hypothetical protein